MLTGLLDRWSEFAVSRNIISTRLPLPMPSQSRHDWNTVCFVKIFLVKLFIYFYTVLLFLVAKISFLSIEESRQSVGNSRRGKLWGKERRAARALGIPCVSLRQLQISCDGNPTKSTRAVHACRVRGSHLACAWPPWIIAARHFRNSKLCPFPISLAYSFENPAFIYNTPALSFKLLGNWRVLSWLNENQGNKNNRIFVGYGYQK